VKRGRALSEKGFANRSQRTANRATPERVTPKRATAKSKAGVVIAKTYTQGSVGKLGDYLSHGSVANGNRVEDRSERVGWESGRNLGYKPTMGEAMEVMRATAKSQAGRVEKEVYHSAENLSSVNVQEVQSVNTIDILDADAVLFQEGALDWITDVLSTAESVPA